MKETTYCSSGRRPVFAARGAILIPARTIPCRFTQDTIDGCFNGLIEVAADPELLKKIAFSRLSCGSNCSTCDSDARSLATGRIRRRSICAPFRFFTALPVP